jgi:hypothetical protein
MIRRRRGGERKLRWLRRRQLLDKPGNEPLLAILC